MDIKMTISEMGQNFNFIIIKGFHVTLQNREEKIKNPVTCT